MKRIISIALIAVMIVTLAVSLCSCEKEECWICGEEKFAMFMEEDELFGQKFYTCKDCQKDLEELEEELED